MAYSHLGFSYSNRPQFLMSSGSCLEPGFTSPSHPALGVPVYERRVLRSPSATGISISGSGLSPKGQLYCSGDAPAFSSWGPLDPKEEAFPAHMGGSQVPAYYPYECPFPQYPFDRYRYSCTDTSSRRKNASRETTSTLKAWLQEHRKNPYPTKGEKIMLAIITKMTLTQVSTWFANARRRLKKENKVTWSPRAPKTSEDLGCGEDSTGGEGTIQCERELGGESDQSADPQSDPEDFDRLGPEVHLVPEDCGGKTHLASLSHSGPPVSSRSYGDRIPSDCPKRTAAAQHHGSRGLCPLVDLPTASEARLKIWSIARQASSLQPDSPPACMLAHRPAPGYPASTTAPVSADAKPSRRHDSPVATLRDWVDGVFCDGRFQQSASDQVTLWEGLIDGQLDCKDEGRSY